MIIIIIYTLKIYSNQYMNTNETLPNICLTIFINFIIKVFFYVKRVKI